MTKDHVGVTAVPAYGKYHLNKRRLAKVEAPKINHLHALAGWLRLGTLRTLFLRALWIVEGDRLYAPRGVIALHSPEGVVETGLLLCP